MTFSFTFVQRFKTAGALLALLTPAGCSSMNHSNNSAAYAPAPPQADFVEPAPAVDPTNLVAADRSSGGEGTATGLINVFGEIGEAPAAAPRYGASGYEQATFLEEGYDSDVAVSPDGKWLAFSSTRHNEHPEVYLQRVGGLSITQLTTDDADDAFPSFSPDGKRVAFSSTRSGNWDIYVMDIDGKNVVQLTSSNMQEMHPSFSPDGNRLAYSAAGTRSGQWELWTIDLRSMERKMIGYGLFPSWSPVKGKDQIAFQRARKRGGRWFSIWTLDLVDGEARNVTEVAVSGNSAVVSPTWNADGSMLAFSTIVNPVREATLHAAGQQDVWIIRADGTGRRRISDGNGVNATPAWSCDGRLFFVSDRGGVDAVWSARAGGTEMKTADSAAATDPFANTDRGELNH